MNPWDLFLNTLGWFFLAGSMIIGVMVLMAITVGVWRGLRRVATRKKPTKMDFHVYMHLADMQAKSFFRNERILQAEMIDAFKEGARWAWEREK